MIRTRAYRAGPVVTWAKTTRDYGSQLAIHSHIVEPFEKGERLRIKNRSIRKRLDLLDNYMIVTDIYALSVDLRGRREVGRLGVGEIAILHALNAQYYVESLICSNVFTVRRGLDCSRWHIGYSNDITHADGVTRTGLDLLAIRDSLSSAKIDEVVDGGEGGGLSSSGILVTVLLGPCTDDARIES
jgi:hypothetical protein